MKVLLSIGGENCDFNFLDANDKVNNLYNSLVEYRVDWGFDGFNLDIRQLDSKNIPYIIKLIQWVRQDYPDAILTLTAQATDVSPDAGGMTGKWNRMVPLINEVRGYIDWIQIMAYGYGSIFKQVQTKQSPPLSPPVGDPKLMLEYIFASFVKPFTFSNPGPESQVSGTAGYYGFDSKKLILGVLPISFLGPEYYVDPGTLKEVTADLQKNGEPAGGVMISSINEDAGNLYNFSREFMQPGGSPA